jgi:hypothetical protein
MKFVHSAATLALERYFRQTVSDNAETHHVHSNIWIITVFVPDGARLWIFAVALNGVGVASALEALHARRGSREDHILRLDHGSLVDVIFIGPCAFLRTAGLRSDAEMACVIAAHDRKFLERGDSKESPEVIPPGL